MTNTASADARALAQLRPWVQAARPLAHPMIFVPLLLGQLFAAVVLGHFSWLQFGYATVFGVLYQIYLLYTNDHADAAIDKTNQQYWLSGGSRVIPEGRLGANELQIGARVALSLLCVLALSIAVFGERLWLPIGVVVAVMLSWAYHRAPLQWSYRGHGEVLQGLGCGVLLPLIGYYLQCGSLVQFPWSTLLPMYIVFHAGNIVTALPDYRSDRAGRKRTFPVRHGEFAGRVTAVCLLVVAYTAAGFIALPFAVEERVVIVAPAGFLLLAIAAMGLIRTANVSDFRRCKQFVTWVSASQAWFLFAWAGVLLVQVSA
ncbi:MAG: prenyltransferase [Pseudomonadota bacterium]